MRRTPATFSSSPSSSTGIRFFWSQSFREALLLLSSSESRLQLLTGTNELFCWKQPKTSAAAFGVSLTVLVSLSKVSIISVVSYLLLTCLCVTITFRYRPITIQRRAIHSSNTHTLSHTHTHTHTTVRPLIDQGLIHVNWFICQTRRLLLVEDVVDSVKLAVVMWLMTYIGAVFNGLSLLILDKPADSSKIADKSLKIFHQFSLFFVRLQNRLPGAVKRTKTG
uniref:Reticulon n=1 Tax=Cynoglossus semilaevis TaxID=244447 RepID=A0A3P8X4R9_CYNSE